MNPTGGHERKLLPLNMKATELKTFEVGLVFLVHAESAEDAQLALESCIRADLRVGGKEVRYCEENLARVTLN
jgi:hypothetical protein